MFKSSCWDYSSQLISCDCVTEYKFILILFPLFLQIAGHKDLLEGDPYLKQRLRLRDAYITTLNVCQAYTLKRIRDPSYDVKVKPHISKDITESSKPQTAELVKLNPTSEYAPGLEDTLILTMKGIAAGMQNTG